MYMYICIPTFATPVLGRARRLLDFVPISLGFG